MARKTFRSIYLSEELESRLLKLAETQGTSASSMVRSAIERYMDMRGLDGAAASTKEKRAAQLMEV